MITESDKYMSVRICRANDIYADIIVRNNDNELIFLSALAYDTHIKNAIKEIKGIRKGYSDSAYCNGRYLRVDNNYKTITKRNNDSDYTHLIMYKPDTYSLNNNSEDYTSYIFIKDLNKLPDEVYKRLVKYSSVPVLRQWTPYIMTKLREINALNELSIDKTVLPSSNTQAQELYVYVLRANKEIIKNIISEGLSNQEINIGGTNEHSTTLDECRGIDAYLNTYGEGLAKKIQRSFTPKFVPGVQEYDTYLHNIDDYIHNKTGKELYEAQRSTIQAIVNNMKINNSTILCGEMGAGKTIMTSSACYTHNANKNKGFNALVMCPSHLVENWKNETEEHIPNAKVYIVHNTDELLDLKPKLLDPYKIENTFVVISKEWAKIGYSYRPAVLFKRAMIYNNRVIRNVYVCPECGQPLMKTVTEKYATAWGANRTRKVTVPMTWEDFQKENAYNQICNNKVKRWNSIKEKYELELCNNKLWTALNRDDENNAWIKLGKAGWVLKSQIVNIMNDLTAKEKLTKKESDILSPLVEQYNLLAQGEELAIHYRGSKKYPMAKYIKERMNGVFDYFIADEV